MKPEKSLLEVVQFERQSLLAEKQGYYLGPKALNGWIFESKSATLAVLLLWDGMGWGMSVHLLHGDTK